jgi:hypothetical protein
VQCETPSALLRLYEHGSWKSGRGYLFVSNSSFEAGSKRKWLCDFERSRKRRKRRYWMDIVDTSWEAPREIEEHLCSSSEYFRLKKDAFCCNMVMDIASKRLGTSSLGSLADAGETTLI